jgi:aryl-alcohol dehydrogenase-like predicted oxidoreductase
MEAEIIPMCEHQGMAIVPWAALGGGQLMSPEERKAKEQEPGARKARGLTQKDVKVSEILGQVAKSKGTTLQAVVSSLNTLKLRPLAD